MAPRPSRLFTLGDLHHTRFRKTVTSSNMPTLVFPSSFVENKWKKGHPAKIIMTTGDGISWPAKIEKRGGEVMLTNGWGMFREFYDFEENDTLVFSYDGRLHFMVTIFDEKTECERLLVKIVEPYSYEADIDSDNPPSSDSPDYEDMLPSDDDKTNAATGTVRTDGFTTTVEISSDSEEDSIQCSQHKAAARRLAQATELLRWSREQTSTILNGGRSDLSKLFDAAAHDGGVGGGHGNRRGSSRKGGLGAGIESSRDGARRQRVTCDKSPVSRKRSGITIGRTERPEDVHKVDISPCAHGHGKGPLRSPDVLMRGSGSRSRLHANQSSGKGIGSGGWDQLYEASRAHGRDGRNNRRRGTEMADICDDRLDDGTDGLVLVRPNALAKHGALQLPVQWARNHLSFGNNSRMFRVDATGSYWNVMCNLTETAAFATVGWLDFAIYNHIKANDQVGIEVDSGDSRLWFIKIYRKD